MNDDVLPMLLEAPPALPVQISVKDGKLVPELMDGETRAMWVSRLKDALGTESDDLDCVYTRFMIEKEHHERRCSYATFTASP